MAGAGLLEQTWYWADADKSIVSRALADQTDGAFIVRNASTPGDYTLSVKYNGQVKLVKIVVRNNKCGFSFDMLNHDTIVQLVDFHKNVSLSSYNDHLDVKLTFPVPARRNSQMARLASRRAAMLAQKNIFKAKTNEEWEERLGLERLRINQMCCERSARLYDVAHAEVERAENLHHTLLVSCRDYEMKLEKLTELADSGAMISNKIEKTAESEMLKEAFRGNRKVLESSIIRIKHELSASQTQKNSIRTVLDEMKAQLANAKSRLVKYHEHRNNTFTELIEAGTAPDKLQSTVESTADMLANEPMQVSQLLADLPLRWIPAQYMIHSPSKEEAAQALLAARKRMEDVDRKMGISRPPISGVFLIRPSASQTEKLVLSVLYGERISHCLIEQNDQGFGFENSNIYLTTIGDFVRYYAHTSLESHNDHIKTTLTMPARPLPSQIFT